MEQIDFYVEAEGRSGEREGIRHARELSWSGFPFLRVELELRANFSRFAHCFNLTIGQCRRIPY